MNTIKKHLISALLAGVNELENIESAIFLSKKNIDRISVNRHINTGIDLLSYYANKPLVNMVDIAVVTGYQNVCSLLMEEIRKENREIISA